MDLDFLAARTVAQCLVFDHGSCPRNGMGGFPHTTSSRICERASEEIKDRCLNHDSSQHNQAASRFRTAANGKRTRVVASRSSTLARSCLSRRDVSQCRLPPKIHIQSKASIHTCSPSSALGFPLFQSSRAHRRHLFLRSCCRDKCGVLSDSSSARLVCLAACLQRCGWQHPSSNCTHGLYSVLMHFPPFSFSPTHVVQFSHRAS